MQMSLGHFLGDEPLLPGEYFFGNMKKANNRKKEKQSELQTEVEKIILGKELITIKDAFFYKNAQSRFYEEADVDLDCNIGSYLNDIGRNILFEGMDGSGKTHTLRKIYYYCIDNYEDLKIFPVWVDLNLNPILQEDIKIYKLRLYRYIALLMIYFLKKNKDILILEPDDAGILEKAKGFLNMESSFDINKALNEIEKAFIDSENELTQEQKGISEKEKGSIRTSIDAKLELLSGGVSGESQKEREITSTKTDINYGDVSEFMIHFFKNISNLLNCNHILILLDGIYETKGDYQKEIFRFLKLLTTINSDTESAYIYFFASVYPPYLMNYPSQNQGDDFTFDLMQDSSLEFLQICELDHSYEKFFVELTQKKWYAIHKNRLDMRELFEGNLDFQLAILCSNGLPGRYFDLLEKSYRNLRQRSFEVDGSQGKISSIDIEIASKQIAKDILYSTMLSNEEKEIRDLILNNLGSGNKTQRDKYIYFTIDVEDVVTIKNLISLGILHDKGRNRSRRMHQDLDKNLIMLDFTIAFNKLNLINRRSSIMGFQRRLKLNLKNNFKDCPHINFS
jgi:hypothetical protein